MNNEATPPPADLVALSEKATPGPWTVADHDDYGDFDGNSRVILGDDRRIGVIQVKSADDEEDNANAELSVALVNWFRSQDWTRPSLSAQAVGDDFVLVRKDVLHLATVTLGHAYHTVLSGELAEDAHTSYQALDAVLDAAGYKSPDSESYVSPMKAIADDLRNNTFVGIGPPLTGPELWLETHKGKK